MRAVAFALVCGGLSASSVADTIDFESLPDNQLVTQVPGFEFLHFAGSAVAQKAGGSLSSAFTPTSGDTVIFDDRSMGTTNPGTITIESVGQTLNTVSAFVQTYALNGVTMAIWDVDPTSLGATPLDSVVTPGAPGGIAQPGFGLPTLLELSGTGIKFITFQDSGNSFTVDDLSFGVESVIIPLPSAAGLGLAGLACIVRRRRA